MPANQTQPEHPTYDKKRGGGRPRSAAAARRGGRKKRETPQPPALLLRPLGDQRNARPAGYRRNKALMPPKRRPVLYLAVHALCGLYSLTVFIPSEIQIFDA